MSNRNFLVKPVTESKTHTMTVLVDNEPGVLARVIGLFSGRGYNIESLTVAEVDPAAHLSRITIVTSGTPMVIEQIKAQLGRLVPVHHVRDVTVDGPAVQRELALIKVRVTGKSRPEVVSIVEMHRGRVVDLSDDAVIVEIVGEPSEVDRVVELLREFGIKELVRTGSVVMSRGSGSIEEQVKR